MLSFTPKLHVVYGSFLSTSFYYHAPSSTHSSYYYYHYPVAPLPLQYSLTLPANAHRSSMACTAQQATHAYTLLPLRLPHYLLRLPLLQLRLPHYLLRLPLPLLRLYSLLIIGMCVSAILPGAGHKCHLCQRKYHGQGGQCWSEDPAVPGGLRQCHSGPIQGMHIALPSCSAATSWPLFRLATPPCCPALLRLPLLSCPLPRLPTVLPPTTPPCSLALPHHPTVLPCHACLLCGCLCDAECGLTPLPASSSLTCAAAEGRGSGLPRRGRGHPAVYPGVPSPNRYVCTGHSAAAFRLAPHSAGSLFTYIKCCYCWSQDVLAPVF